MYSKIFFSVMCLEEGWGLSINDKKLYDLLPATSVPKTLNIVEVAEIYVAGFLETG